MRTVLLTIACAIALAACGDNKGTQLQLAPTHDLVVVAHPDDELFFMEPDTLEAVRRGTGVTNVYVTAGNGSGGDGYASHRYHGLREAYAAAAGEHDWQCGWVELADHPAQLCRLPTANVSLVFLAYPDGGLHGEEPDSLLHLWQGDITGAETVAEHKTRYTRDDLIAVLAEIMRQTSPKMVRTLEVSATHGTDHPDHMIVGALTVLGMARAGEHGELRSYRGYDITREPENRDAAIYAALFPVIAQYESCATGCAPCGQPCKQIVPGEEAWLQRRYAVGFRRSAAGLLRQGDQCLTPVGDSTAGVVFTSCDTAASWQLDEAGELVSGGSCLDVGALGVLTLATCNNFPEQQFVFDDEGHLWSGRVPIPRPVMAYAHLWCLAPNGTTASATLCGADLAPTWTVVRPPVVTPRATLGFAETGRAVRLGDLTGDGIADLCAVTSGGLMCAPGDGTGAFGPAIRIDSAAAPLAIEPTSLVIGDIDGDGLADACGRTTKGLVCATAASGFGAAPYSPAFDHAHATAATSASLAMLPADGKGKVEICGLASDGVVCAPPAPEAPELRSTWPKGASVLWPADLDGDGLADWCALVGDAECSVGAEAAVSNAGVPWNFSNAGVLAPMPDSPDVGALGDIDGDGRADLCQVAGSQLTCARSQSRGFGPPMTVAVLPDGANATAMWLGDLDGDGRLDSCADIGDAVACTLGP